MRILIQFLWLLLFSNPISIPQGMSDGLVLKTTTHTEQHRILLPYFNDASNATSFFAEIEEFELEEDERHISSCLSLSPDNFLNYLHYTFQVPLEIENGIKFHFLSSKIPFFIKFSSLII